MKPLVTIQIPTYNQKEYIKNALDSALAQTYENLQIIVSDDCSSDYDIFEYLKDYSENPKILIHRNDKNLGRVGNYRNTLYNLVEGEWFVNLDGDDYFTELNFITYAITIIKKSNTEIAVFQGNAQISKISTLQLNCKKINSSVYLVKGRDYINHLHDGLGFTHASLLFNTAMAKRSRFYNLDILDSDYFSFLKILKTGSIVFWDAPIYHWRQHSQQQTLSLNFNKVLPKFLALKELKDFYKDVPNYYTKNMFYTTHLNLFSQLCLTFLEEKFNIIRFTKLLLEIRFNIKYLIKFGSTLKKMILQK